MNIPRIPQLSVSQHWLKPVEPHGDYRAFRPALLVECGFKFHNLRAHIKHTEDHRFSAWFPKGDGAADWDAPPAVMGEDAEIWNGPPLPIPYQTDDFLITPEIVQAHVDRLVESRSRTAKLHLFFNRHFQEYSEPREERTAFVARLSERAAEIIEDDLAELIARVNLKLAQVREAHERRGRARHLPATKLNEVVTLRRHELFSSQSRLETLFTSGERLVVSDYDKERTDTLNDLDMRELRQSLEQIEDDAKRQLNELCTLGMQKAAECDAYEIGLQPQQIKITRQCVLWIAVS
jgi:hypothetical protein